MGKTFGEYIFYILFSGYADNFANIECEYYKQ